MKLIMDIRKDSPFCYDRYLEEDVEWIISPIVQQTELECGAISCLHGVLFALSDTHSHDSIINELKKQRTN
jgi:hypothetical protein